MFASGVALACLLCPRLLQPGLTLNSGYKLGLHFHPPHLQKVTKLTEHPFTVSAGRWDGEDIERHLG